MFTVKKMVAGLAIVAAAGSAQAALVTGASGTDGDLFFIAFDPTTNHTLIKDLGVNFSYAADNFGKASFFSSVNLGALVNSGTGAGAFNFSEGLQWNIAATRNSTAVVNASTSKNGLFSTVNSDDAGTTKVDFQAGTNWSGALYNATLGKAEIKTYGKAALLNNALGAADYVVVDDPSAHGAYDTVWGNNFGYTGLGVITSGTVGETLDWYHWYINCTSAANLNLVTQSAGSWTLSQAGVLSYAPAVPVPAAAWLFGSALLGLGFVPRRHKK